MTPTETAAILRQFNEWRRGDEDIPQPDPREIGEAIDAAVEMIERMEKQVPIGWFARIDGDGPLMECKHADISRVPLYLAPGAQPAPSIPEGWKPIPEKHPTFDLVDLKLADGSVLCGCVPQSDGDYWWEGPSGEVFIDP